MSRMVYYDSTGNEIFPEPESAIVTTHADRIRQMTDEELADWIARILTHCDGTEEIKCMPSCPLYKCCNDQPSDNIEDWLKSPVEIDT